VARLLLGAVLQRAAAKLLGFKAQRGGGGVRADLTEFIPFFFYGGLPAPGRFGMMLLVSTMVDLLIADRLLFGRWRWLRPAPTVGMPRVLGVAALLAILFMIKSVVIGPRYSYFALVSVLWYDLLFVGPWCGIRALLRDRNGGRVTGLVKVLAVVCLAFLPVAAWARFVEPFRLQIEEVFVPRREGARAGVDRPALRVAVLADLQTDRIDRYEREVIDRTLELKPDLILIPGDLFQGFRGLFNQQRDTFREALGRLSAPGGVFFAQGDVDPPDYIEGLLEGTSIRWLRNEMARVEVKGRVVFIAGLLRSLGDPSRAAVRSIEGESEDSLKLVLCHYARAAALLSPGSDVDLVIGGHTHGGQIVIPGFGPPVTLSPLPRNVGAGGLHQLKDRRVYVSRGIGMERGYAPRIRFFCPPELTLLQFE